MIPIERVIFFVVEFILLYTLIFYLILFFEGKNTKRKKLSREPIVSIIIPAYNEEKTIHKCISSVLNIDYPKEKLDVIVVNDGSTDRTGEIAAKFGNKIRLINQKNQGKARALNNGLKIVRGEYFATLDADSFVDKNILREMLPYFDNKTAAVTPLMEVYKPKNILQSAQKIEYLICVLIKKCVSIINSIFVTPGPFTIYRTETIKKLGGFDEESIVEDQEIAYRLQKHHYKIKQSDGGIVYTIAPMKFKDFYYQRIRWEKGTIQTLLDYRNLILNPNYGDFGLFQLPINFFGLILPFVTLYFLYRFVFMPTYDYILNLIVTNFSFIFRFPNITTTLMSLSFSTFFLNLTYLVLFLFAGKIAYDYANEKLKKNEVLGGVFFFLFYYIITGFITLIAAYEVLAKKRGRRW